MTHVHISTQNGIGKVVVDGMDLSRAVLRSGFAVEFTDDLEPPLVTMTIAADTLDCDLPEVVLSLLERDIKDSAC